MKILQVRSVRCKCIGNMRVSSSFVCDSCTNFGFHCVVPRVVLGVQMWSVCFVTTILLWLLTIQMSDSHQSIFRLCGYKLLKAGVRRIVLNNEYPSQVTCALSVDRRKIALSNLYGHACCRVISLKYPQLIASTMAQSFAVACLLPTNTGRPHPSCSLVLRLAREHSVRPGVNCPTTSEAGSLEERGTAGFGPLCPECG